MKKLLGVFLVLMPLWVIAGIAGWLGSLVPFLIVLECVLAFLALCVSVVIGIDILDN